MMGKIKNVPHHQPEILLYIIKLYHDYYFDDDGDYDCDCDSDDDNRCVCSLPSTTTRTHFKLDPTLGCPGQLPSTKKKSSTSPLPIHLQNNGQKTWEHVGSVQEKGVPKGTQVLELDFRLVNHLGPWPCLSALPSRWNNKFKEIPRLLP